MFVLSTYEDGADSPPAVVFSHCSGDEGVPDAVPGFDESTVDSETAPSFAASVADPADALPFVPSAVVSGQPAMVSPVVLLPVA